MRVMVIKVQIAQPLLKISLQQLMMNIKLHVIVSDLEGLSPMRAIRAIAEGHPRLRPYGGG
jgi:hypothetical protein